MVYADDVNILGGSVLTIEKNTEALAVSSKDSGLEVNADKIKYMVMSRDQNEAVAYPGIFFRGGGFNKGS